MSLVKTYGVEALLLKKNAVHKSNTGMNKSMYWLLVFNPSEKILAKLESFPNFRGEKKDFFETTT